MLLTDLTEKTQLEPYVRPETLTDPPVAVTNGVGITIDSGAAGDTKLTTYPVIGLAALEGFATHVSLITPAVPRTAVTFGAPGRGYGVNMTVSLWPASFIATTVKVVATPFFIPGITNEVAVGPAIFGFLLSGTQITL